MLRSYIISLPSEGEVYESQEADNIVFSPPKEFDPKEFFVYYIILYYIIIFLEGPKEYLNRY